MSVTQRSEADLASPPGGRKVARDVGVGSAKDECLCAPRQSFKPAGRDRVKTSFFDLEMCRTLFLQVSAKEGQALGRKPRVRLHRDRQFLCDAHALKSTLDFKLKVRPLECQG